ncbi:MAG: cation-translocating P-type ATPase [Candidatus Kariarchaeaceae archaeon]|jgi:Ca2+-transporting ATPase
MSEEASTAYIVEHGHAQTLDKVVKHLRTDPEKGISISEAVQRSDAVGPNLIVTPSPSVWQVYLAPLFDTLITVYLIITGIMVFLALFVDEILSKVAFWLVMIAFNFAMAIFQQYRAQKKVQALANLSPPVCKVIRNGEFMELEARELVPGDLVDLALGDRIPADARIVSSSSLTVNEASLTGESVAVKKMADGSEALDHETPIAKHSNMVYLGTFVQTGSGKAIVTKTGNDTELGRIATEMSSMSSVEIPLRTKVNTLGKGLSALMVAFLVILVASTAIRRANSGVDFTFEQFAFDIAQAIINAMSVLPINIPLLTTVVLITGVLNMASKKVVIKELSAVETLGRCSVLCSDKTGTITTGKMTVKMVWDTNHYYQVLPKEDYRNEIYKIETDNILDNVDKLPEDYEIIEKIEPESALELLMTCAVLNNDADITPVESEDGSIDYKIVGNFTDGALLVLSQTNGLQISDIKQRYQQITSYPFDSSLKRMSGLFKDTQEDDFMIFSKGASEVILPLCAKIGDEANVKKMTKKQRTTLLKQASDFADQGYRVISLAYKPADEFEQNGGDDQERERAESDLIFIGFSIIYDPPRPRVYQAVADLDSAGIFPIMITGDSKSTAGTIARQVGILDGDEMVVEGSQAAHLPDEEFFKVSVFARVAPKDKEIIVNRYQERGDIVAMTGDGVNDALAITRSDAGVAMGISGTEVAKEAADIILTDDSYVSLVEGVREGRNLYNKIRIMIFFYIAVNLAEAIMYFTTSFRLDFFLLNNWQRAYIFAVAHAVPVLAIIFGPDDSKVMTLKPRQNDALLTKKLINLVAIFSISTGLILIAAYFMYYGSEALLNPVNSRGITPYLSYFTESDNLNDALLPEDLTQAKARTMLLTIIYLVECLFVFSIIRVNQAVWDIKDELNGDVFVMILSPLVFHFSMMYITPIQLSLFNGGVAFELIPLSFGDLALAFVFAAIPIIAMEAYKYYVRVIERDQF